MVSHFGPRDTLVPAGRGSALRCIMAAIIAIVLSTLLVSCQREPRPFDARLVAAAEEPQNWLTTGRTYGEERFSPLKDINIASVGRLGLAWSYDLDTDRGQETTPLAVDGVLYTTSAWSKVQAFDAVSGTLLWQFDPKVPGTSAAELCCDVVNRGAAYWDGLVYVGTIDGRLIAVDAKTGQQRWSTQTVAAGDNNRITGAPRVVKGLVIIGNGGADAGARGYVSAYDARTGRKVWRFYTVPGAPGHPDGEVSDKVLARVAGTWAGEWWKPQAGRGGGTVWDAIAYDPDLNLLYIGVGNGGFWNRTYRSAGRGDNLFISSIVALRPETGEYVWHYQETPGDEWDYTATQHMILTNLKIGGTMRKVLMQAPKNGYFYVLDRATGKLMSAKPYIPLNWSTGIDPKTGRPMIKPEARYDLTGKQWIAMPGPLGGHNWQPMAYNPVSGLVYVPGQELAGLYEHDPAFKPLPLGTATGTKPYALPVAGKSGVRTPIPQPNSFLLAWDPVAQKEVWRAPNPGYQNGGVLTTAGDIVVQGDQDGHVNIYHAHTGARLWSFDGQSAVLGSPISYAVHGRQYLTIVVGFGGAVGMSTGESAWSKGQPRRNRSRVLTFALDAKGALPPADPRPLGRLDPPAQFAGAADIEAGRVSYLKTCRSCHGLDAKSAGVIPDLRYSSAIASRESFYAIVGDGALADRGMSSYLRNFDARQIEQIRAFVISRATADAAASGKPAPKASPPPPPAGPAGG